MYKNSLRFVFLFSLLFSKTLLASDVSGGFADLAEKLVPAVVNISIEHTVKESAKKRSGTNSFNKGSMFEEFRDFFERIEPFLDKNQEGVERDYISLGSGFVVDKEGIIITNSHVISDAKEVTVTLSNNNQYKATILGKDEKSDLAVLKIKTSEKLNYVHLGNSDKMRVGDWVIAIGNPFGLGGSVSVGIISARARDINMGSLSEFIQTDAAINKGNSGGPLFNTNGEVIGMNTAIFSTPNGGNVGIGFAIPSNSIKDIVKLLADGKKITHGWMGVKIQIITKEIAESLGMKNISGVLIAEVSAGSPANKAGLKVGDVILEFNGEKILSMSKLPYLVTRSKLDRYVDVLIYRNKKRVIKSVKIGDLDSSESQLALENNTSYRSNELGLVVEDGVSSAKNKCKGVTVLELERGGDLFFKGVRSGDSIVAINQKNIDNVSSFKKEMESVLLSGSKNVLLLVCRGDNNVFITVRLNK